MFNWILKPINLYIIIFILALFGWNETVFGQFNNGMRQNFGKSRVQHEDFFWTYYEFKDYKIYQYRGGEKLSEYIAQNYRENLKDIEKKIGFGFTGELNFIVYNKQSEYKQSNIDFDNNESGTGGVTEIASSNIFLYFEGDYNTFHLQLRQGLSEMLVKRMFFGDNWKEVIRNATLLTIPEWYTDGLVSYISEPWSVEIDNRVKDGIMTNRFKKFNHLNGADRTYAGHAIWNYIAEVYGPEVIPNVLYMARVSRSIESGFLFVLGATLNDLTNDAWLHYQVKYEMDEKSESFPDDKEIPIRTIKKREYYQISKSPEGNQIAYVKNNEGRYKIQLLDLEKNRRKTIAKGGIRYDRLPDYSYPLIEWRPDGKVLAIIEEEKAEPFLTLYEIESKKGYERPVFRVDEVVDMSYLNNGKKLILSATLKGQSDLWEYNLMANTVKKLTDDIYDDLYPKYTNDGEEIIFSSNRPTDSLFSHKKFRNDMEPTKDLFLFQGKTKPLIRISETPFADEVHPHPYGKNQFVYLGDKNGVKNRYIARIDSVVTSVDTTINYRYVVNSSPLSNYDRNIKEQQIIAPENLAIDLVYKDKKYKLYQSSVERNEEELSGEMIETEFRKEGTAEVENSSEEKLKIVEVSTVVIEEEKEEEESIVDIEDYTFGGEQRDKMHAEKSQNFVTGRAKNSRQDTSKVKLFDMPQERNYNKNFSYTNITSTLDFNFANQLYQPFNGGPYTNPGMGILMKVSLFDLFQDYKVEGGARVGFRNSSLEMFMGLHDRSKRLDKSYLVKRQSLKYVTDVAASKVIIWKGEYLLNYPLTEFLSVRGELNFRVDRTISSALEDVSLVEPSFIVSQPGVKVELVFDNAKSKGLNLYNGTKFKIFAERYQLLNDINSDLNVFGADYRHYQKISRDLIWASRVAASTSLGKRKLVYYLGSVDDWITLNPAKERFNRQTPIAQDQSYTFQALASPMRGFIQNARNGNSFGVINNEIRFPVFRYFARKPLKSDFTNNFQIVAFGDLGTAWNGRTPFSEDNEFNTIAVVDGPITIRLDNKRNPVIGSFGGGFRTKLLGYFLKLDYAYGVEDGQVLKPIFHVSMGFDF